MLALLTLSAVVLAHAGELPHVHPHETGIALGLALVVAFTVGTVVATLKRRPAAP